LSTVLALVTGHSEISRDWPYCDDSLAAPRDEEKSWNGEELGRSNE